MLYLTALCIGVTLKTFVLLGARNSTMDIALALQEPKPPTWVQLLATLSTTSTKS